MRQLLLFISVFYLAGCVDTLFDFGSEVVETKSGHCIKLAPGSEWHQLMVCEQNDHYTFLENDKPRKAFAAQTYQNLIESYLKDFLNETDLPKTYWKHAEIDVWVGTHPLAPREIHLYVAAKLPEQGFLLKLPVDPDRWHISSDNLFILPQSRFPAPSILRSGKIKLSSKPHIRAARFEGFLKQTGFTYQRPVYSSVMVEVPLFQELSVIRKLQSHPEAKHVLHNAEPLWGKIPDNPKAKLCTIYLEGKAIVKEDESSLLGWMK